MQHFNPREVGVVFLRSRICGTKNLGWFGGESLCYYFCPNDHV